MRDTGFLMFMLEGVHPVSRIPYRFAGLGIGGMAMNTRYLENQREIRIKGDWLWIEEVFLKVVQLRPGRQH